MKIAKIAEARNQLSSLLAQVQRGETIVITDRDRPVAHLGPVPTSVAGSDDRTLRLERAGLLRRGAGGLVRDLVEHPALKLRKPVDLMALLAEERDER